MKKLDLNNMHEWPIITRCILIALVCVIVFYFGNKWDLVALQKKLQISKTEENDLKLQYASVIKKQMAAKVQVLHFNDMRVLLNEWQKRLIAYNELPDLLNQILKIGNNNSLYFNLFDPGEAIVDNNYMKVPIKVVAAGTYHQLADFISQLANLPWIVVVDNFTLSNENTTEVLGAKMAETANSQNLLTLDMTLDVYYKPEHPIEKKPEVENTTENTAANPAANPATNTPATPAENKVESKHE
jgi:type IV pilus assembly protein PilO